MGSYLSRYLGRYLGLTKAKLWPPARARKYPQPRQARNSGRPGIGRDLCQVTHVYPKRRVRTQPLPNISPLRAYTGTRRVMKPQDWSGYLPRLPPRAFMGLDSPSSPAGQMKLWLWNNRYRRHIQSPVTVKINPPGQEENLFKFTCPPMPERPDPCAKETVLRALSQCNKGKRKFDGPLWFELPDPKRRRQSPERWPSVFKTVPRKGVILTLVPRPGPLRRVSEESTAADPPTTLSEPSLSAACPAAGTPPARATVTASAGELGGDQHSSGPEEPPFVIISY